MDEGPILLLLSGCSIGKGGNGIGTEFPLLKDHSAVIFPRALLDNKAKDVSEQYFLLTKLKTFGRGLLFISRTV